MLLRIGQYLLRIVNIDFRYNAIPSKWHEYFTIRSDFSESVVLLLEEGAYCSDTKLPEGWFLDSSSGNKKVCYIIKGKIAFEIQYDFSLDKNLLKIRVMKATENYLSLGIQYGILLALNKRCIGLHGVTLLCRNEIITLSAPSGTGKTTLSKLLEKYCDASVINGDFALLSLTEEGVIFEPTPFCGTSQRRLNHRVKVNRIVFLSQSKSNEWNCLTGRQALIHFLNNTFIPSWDYELERIVKDNIMKSLSYLKVNSFSFSPDKEAAELLFSQLN